MQADFIVFVAWNEAHILPELHMPVSRQADFTILFFVAWTEAHTLPELHMVVSRQADF